MLTGLQLQSQKSDCYLTWPVLLTSFSLASPLTHYTSATPCIWHVIKEKGPFHTWGWFFCSFVRSRLLYRLKTRYGYVSHYTCWKLHSLPISSLGVAITSITRGRKSAILCCLAFTIVQSFPHHSCVYTRLLFLCSCKCDYVHTNT